MIHTYLVTGHYRAGAYKSGDFRMVIIAKDPDTALHAATKALKKKHGFKTNIAFTLCKNQNTRTTR